MENIGNFLSGCEAYGCPKTDIFQTVDLYEAQNIPQVSLPTKMLFANAYVARTHLPLLGGVSFAHAWSLWCFSIFCFWFQVINGIIALARKAQKKGVQTSTQIAPKESSENPREFSEEQLQEGKKTIGLQMGSNKGASQAGQTAYGLGRQIRDDRYWKTTILQQQR